MTDDKGIVRGYSQDREIYRDNSISIKRKPSAKINVKPANYYSNRNCPEILSLFALTNRHLDDREKQIYRSVTNDIYHFNTINYPLQSPPTTPISNLPLENNNNKQLMFPKVTPRSTSITTGNRFPTFTPRSISINFDEKNPVPTIRTSAKTISSSLKKPLQTNMPIISTEKKKKIHVLERIQRPE